MSDVVSTDRLVGKIKWFNSSKGYGFVKLPEGDKDVFIHANQLRKSGIDRVLTEGETVSFATSVGGKGQYAVDIEIVANNHQAES